MEFRTVVESTENGHETSTGSVLSMGLSNFHVVFEDCHSKTIKLNLLRVHRKWSRECYLVNTPHGAKQSSSCFSN